MKFFLLCFVLIGTALATPETSLYERLATVWAKNLQPETRIVGGTPAAKSQVTPYLVSLSASSLAYAHVCAGAIIGKEWVLTAAHCLSELQKSAVSVIGLPIYAGLQDRSNVENAQVRNIDFAFAHKQFNVSDVSSPDIALLHVAQGFDFSASVNSAILPYAQESYANQTALTYGWGLTSAGAEQFVQELQVANSTILSVEQCSEVLPEDAPLGANKICAATSACFGDGGSPLVYETSGGSELVGITSWSYLPCGTEGRPAVYTEVSRFVKWIAEVQWAYYVLN
ncbi:unnamed protein product [Ceratitis capitata]|uniref:(Mediterranean fruit fly) hypothetical protein n=1 Tax=Ceratitis capitata TaxID=7213 RepID=A0A811VIF5_CERCA|nr:unnamed protein product [Ceratitis capitata]